MNNLYLSDKIGSDDIVKEPTRKGFGRGLLEAGKRNEAVVALCADLTESTQMHLFRDEFPRRFVEIGVAEQNLATVAAGMAGVGKIPFTSSYAAFSPGRNWEQIRTTACLNERPVKIVGSHAGLYTGADGATHQMLEDIALMRVLPKMVVVAPGDSNEAFKATLAIAENGLPSYIRLAREATPIFTTEQSPFEIGKAYVLLEGSDMTIASTGVMTYRALMAARILKNDGISVEVVHCPTIKPLDVDTLEKSVRKTNRILTLEEHQIQGGFGSAVAENLMERYPCRLKRVGMQDRFGESGKPDELFKHFGLTETHIAMAAHELMDSSKVIKNNGQ